MDAFSPMTIEFDSAFTFTDRADQSVFQRQNTLTEVKKSWQPTEVKKEQSPGGDQRNWQTKLWRFAFKATNQLVPSAPSLANEWKICLPTVERLQPRHRVDLNASGPSDDIGLIGSPARSNSIKKNIMSGLPA